jgi:mono/diheme cytochrome c family protein
VEQKAREEDDAVRTDPVCAGQMLYERRCQTCHQASGQGVPGVFPPLIGSEWETGQPETPVRIVLNGLQGPIEVAGSTYNGFMPAWRDQLSDSEIAAVVTFIRQWNTNDAGPVPPELVAQLRAATAARPGPWTAEELRVLESGP